MFLPDRKIVFFLQKLLMAFNKAIFRLQAKEKYKFSVFYYVCMRREIRLKVDDTVGPRKLWNRKTTLKQL